MKIPFDIKYRPQIESGEYKVETKNGYQVEILKFGIEGPDFHIAGIIHRIYFDEVVSWTNNGMFHPEIFRKESPNDLVLITPEPELTDFDKIWEEEDCDEIISLLQDTTPTLKEKLKELCHAWYDKGFDKAYHNQDEVVAFNAFEECAKQIKKKLDGYRLITFNQLRLIIDKLVEDARKKYLGGK